MVNVIISQLVINRSKILTKPLIIPINTLTTTSTATIVTCKLVIESAQVILNHPCLQIARIDSIESHTKALLVDENLAHNKCELKYILYS